MPELKPLFFKLLAPLTNLFSIPRLRTLAGINLIVPVYHTVADSTPEHIRYLYRIKDTRAFRQDIETFLKYFRPITIQQLIKYAETGSEPSEPVFHLTFDDGLSEFYSVIAPILKEIGIPATCFLNNDFIDNKKLFFRFKESILVNHLHNESRGSASWNIYHNWARDNKLEKGYYRKIILGIDYKNSHLLDDLAKRLSINFDEYLKKKKPYLESKQIKELIRGGFTFGSHSTDHMEYRYIDENEQFENTKKSMDDIVQKFNPGYRVFSFPFTDFGVSRSFYDNLRINHVASIAFGCAGIKKDFAPISQQRIPIELYNDSCENVLKKEYMYYIFLKSIGKGKMKR